MLRFYKVNDPYRLIFLFLLALVLRIPFYWNGIEALSPDLHYMLIGEHLSSGFTLYQDLWANIGPFSAYFFSMMDWLFGRSILSYHIIGFMLMMLQAILFNRLALINKIYTENNFVPAVIYVLLMSLSVDMFAVSPIMLSNTFILLAMNHIFGQVEFRAKRDEKILNIGIYLGVASLFYFPSLLYGLISIVGLALFSGTIIRRYFLILFGLVLPLAVTATYYFAMDTLNEVIQVFFSSWFQDVKFQMSTKSILLIFTIPLVFLLSSIYRVIQGSRFSNYQSRIAQLMTFWLFFSLFILLMSKSGPADFVVFIPGIAYFISQYFILSKKGILSELSFTLFFFAIVGVSYAASFGWFGLSKHIDYSPLVLRDTKYTNLLNRQKLWVIGDELQYYKTAQLGTKYYDWKIAEKFLFNNDDDVLSTSLIYENITTYKPDVIIDLEDRLVPYLERMPLVKAIYDPLEKGVYVRKGYELKPVTND